ncbi:MAG: fatty acyl-AMP ligase [Corynebacterium sp.]|nr:fatty acyl-AMP ligase [Corynebacterium sp.]
MDTRAVIGMFLGEDGQLNLPEQATVPVLCELMYSMKEKAGELDQTALSFHNYAADEVVHVSLRQFFTRVRAVAGRIQQVMNRGDRVAILCSNSPEYLYSYLGVMYAGCIPVPLYDPNEPGHAGHLAAVLDDATCALVLTNRASAATVRALFASRPGTERPRILTVDALPDTLASEFDPAQAAGSRDDIAFIQYTSGSTRNPAGVQVSHRALLTNIVQIMISVQPVDPISIVTWLPLHHDMGLVLCSVGAALGFTINLMTPAAFVQKPDRWIELLSTEGKDHNVYTVVPNFALELAARYGSPETIPGLDLSRLGAIINGSEPVTAQAIDAFVEVYGPYGLDKSVIRPSYGLAEAALIVATPQTANRPRIEVFDREALAEGRAEIVSGDGAAVASVGQPVGLSQVLIVDPQTRQEVPEGTIGEIWIHGDNVASGYYERPDDTAATFNQTLAGDSGWLATGDLAAMIDGEIFITGRLKDVIVIAGRNHYPADIERTVAEATAHVTPTGIAAFAVPGADVEQLVILAERAEGADPAGDAAAVEAIAAAVAGSHGVRPKEVRIVESGAIARSSSGKIARKVNQQRYIADNEAQ